MRGEESSEEGHSRLRYSDSIDWKAAICGSSSAGALVVVCEGFWSLTAWASTKRKCDRAASSKLKVISHKARVLDRVSWMLGSPTLTATPTH